MPYAPEGNPVTAEVVFVGEAPAKMEMIKGHPFAGNSGMVFNECLDFAGIMRSYCYITNIFDFPIKKQKGKSIIYNQNNEVLFSDTKEGFTDIGKKSVERLQRELIETKANVIVPLGVPAFRAICSGRGITKWRGSVLPATMFGIEGRKCIPSIHPANALWGQYINRYIIKSDFEKAFKQIKFPEIRRPPYNFILRPTFNQCLEMIEFLKHKKMWAADIEIGFVHKNANPRAQMTRISFAWSDYDAISVPTADGNWSEEEETVLMLKLAELLETPGPVKIFQNGVFDCQVLFIIHNILVAPPLEDTMIAHHIVYPDFKKGLGFLGSLHTNQSYWKGMVKHGELENPEG